MAPRLFVPPSLLPHDGCTLRITGQPHRHLVRVLRLVAGDQITVFNGEGEEIAASLVRVQSDYADLSLGERRQCPASPAQIVLLQAVAKGDRMDLILQKTTELGVSQVWPVITSRSVVRLTAETATGKQARWQKIVQEAARQCGRADVPAVEKPQPLSAALAAVTASQKFVLWEAERGQSLVGSVLAGPTSVALLVGPEGGLSEPEVAQAHQADFATVTLGPRILRTETAAIVAVALVQAAKGGLA